MEGFKLTISPQDYAQVRLKAISDAVYVAYSNAVAGEVAEFGTAWGGIL